MCFVRWDGVPGVLWYGWNGRVRPDIKEVATTKSARTKTTQLTMQSYRRCYSGHWAGCAAITHRESEPGTTLTLIASTLRRSIVHGEGGFLEHM